MEIRWWNPVFLSKYPHLGFREADLWNKVLPSITPDALKIAYDVPLLNRKTELPPSETNYVRDWEYLCSFKIDIVVKLKFGYQLIEVKADPTANAFGQLLVYEYLSERHNLFIPLTRKSLICWEAPPALHEASTHFKIEIIEVKNL